MLWRCWLGGRKGIRPVKTEWWGAGVVICLGRGADLHMAQLMSLPLTVSCFSKIQIGFPFLVPAYLGSPGKRAVICVFNLPQKKTSSNCCSAALAVYLLLFSASYYLHCPSTAPGTRYKRSARIDMDVLRIAAAACFDVCCISAQRGVLRDWIVSKKTGSMY